MRTQLRGVDANGQTFGACAGLPSCFFWLAGMLSIASGCFNAYEVYGADVVTQHWHFDQVSAGQVSSVFPLRSMFRGQMQSLQGLWESRSTVNI